MIMMDNMLSLDLKTPRDQQRDLTQRFKARRLALNLTQEGLAARAGVNWSSLKRFEHTGMIALESLLKLAMVLGCLSDFDRICIDEASGFSGRSLDETLRKPKLRRKGRIK